MGAGASTKIDKSSSLGKFIDAFSSMADKSGPAKGARAQAWMGADPNGNGYVSLAELCGWVKKALMFMYGNDEGDTLYKRYYPSYIRAFNDAKDIDKRKSKVEGVNADDYLTRNEFRLCCAYLCLYSMMFDAFSLVDGNQEGGHDGDEYKDAHDDRKITLEELKSGYQKVQAAGYGFVGLNELDEAGIESTFKEMDANGKGAVLLKEWCEWIEKKEKSHGTEWGKTLGAGEGPVTA